MKWSEYNYIYESKRYGRLLFNLLSGAFIDLNENSLYKTVCEIKSNPNNYLVDEELYKSLIENGVLCEDDSINRNITEYIALSHMFSPQERNLVILPTLNCNLACSYCYEGKNIQNKIMSEDTLNVLKKFIKKNYDGYPVKLNWYGGEPLLAFNIIKDISSYIQSIGIQYQASIVTNGVLLNEKIINDLENLKISDIQITLDGWKEKHDNRRKFKNRKGTFDTIIKNLTILHRYIEDNNSPTNVSIRINVDKENKDDYHIAYDQIREMFPNFTCYPGLLRQYNTCNSIISCFTDLKEYTDFLLYQYDHYGICSFDIFPIPKNLIPCIAESPYTNIVGPDGELYICLKDVGDLKESIGNIHEGRNNTAMIAMYGTGYLTFRNSECQNCKALSICGGGCPNVRYRNLKYGENNDTCSPFKYNDYIDKCLDIYYDYLKNKNS